MIAGRNQTSRGNARSPHPIDPDRHHCCRADGAGRHCRRPPGESRCDQLLEYFDYYGQSRGEGVTDGARNMTRIGAGIDCDKGDYQAGIGLMEALLLDKRMGIPAPGQDG